MNATRRIRAPLVPGHADVIRVLGALASLSNRMLDAANAHAWHEVTELERERAQLVELLFGGPLPVALHDLVADTVSGMLRSDRETSELAARAREAARAELDQHARGRQAAVAYRNEALAGA